MSLSRPDFHEAYGSGVACEEVGDLLLCSKPVDGSRTVRWDVGSGTLWQVSTGSWAEWATALIAALAVWFALRASSRANALSARIVGLEEAREARSEELERERRRREEREAQADLVAGWLAIDPAASLYGDEGLVVARWKMILSNASPLPVYGVRAHVVGPGQWDYVRHSEFESVLPPGQTEYSLPTMDLLPLTHQGPDGEPVHEQEGMEDLSMRLWFQDTGGRGWKRDEDGILTLVNLFFVANAGDPADPSAIDLTAEVLPSDE
jgi:hypothetical protein